MGGPGSGRRPSGGGKKPFGMKMSWSTVIKRLQKYGVKGYVENKHKK